MHYMLGSVRPLEEYSSAVNYLKLNRFTSNHHKMQISTILILYIISYYIYFYIHLLYFYTYMIYDISIHFIIFLLPALLIIHHASIYLLSYSLSIHPSTLFIISSIYIKLQFLFVCLFVCQIITHEPLHRFSSNFNWGTRENLKNVITLVLYVSIANK